MLVRGVLSLVSEFVFVVSYVSNGSNLIERAGGLEDEVEGEEARGHHDEIGRPVVAPEKETMAYILCVTPMFGWAARLWRRTWMMSP